MNTPQSPGLSIIVPLLNEAANLPRLHGELSKVISQLNATYKLPCEVIYIDDGSTDTTWAVVRELPARGFSLQLLSLSRNFGKESALRAGLDYAQPQNALLFMDGDGQHSPQLIDTLVKYWQDEDYDVIYTAKAHRQDEPRLRRLAAKIFYGLINWGARQKLPEDAGDFRLLSPRAAQALRQLPERERFFKGLASWIGFRQMRVEYEPPPRLHGKTKWNLAALLELSIGGITSFSLTPLRMASLLGLIISSGALLYGLWILLETMLYGRDVPGYPSLIIGIMVLGGVQLFVIGIVGEYIGKILSELKARPIYFIAEHQVKAAENVD